MKIHDSVVLVTGANRGVGRALLDVLLAKGARRIYAAARNAAQADGLRTIDRERIVPLTLDVTSQEQIDAAARAASDTTILVNNAGVLGGYDLFDTPLAALEADFQTNFYGPLAMAKAFVPVLERAKEKAIVNVLTIVSLASMPGLGGYSASKAAAFSMTQALRSKLRAKGITVHAVFPGPVDTDMIRSFEMQKASAESVALAITSGVERGDEDISPDAVSRDVVATWRKDPKALEARFGAA